MKSIALVGNPNSGKTTLYNALTGSNQHVGNWPGVTVEKKEGRLTHNGITYNVVDLPGAYSLGSFSQDEIVSRNYILEQKPDVVINVLDATNIERNLYLTTQLLEMGANVVIALNMMDELKQKNINIDIESLAKQLEVPVIPTIASKKKGLDKLLDACVKVFDKKTEPLVIQYEESLEIKLNDITKKLPEDLSFPKRWVAVKLLEADSEVERELSSRIDISKINDSTDSYELEIVDGKYSFIKVLLNKVVQRPSDEVITLTDKIDNVLTNKWLGLPIFALIMFTIFQLTFLIGQDLLGGYLETLMEWFGQNVEIWLNAIGAPIWLISFITDGVIGGVGAVIVFVPLIVMLYFFLAILEDSGYMARAAYVMDGIMRAVGLHGKTFISMIVGFGCNVPGVMATRTLDNKKDRMIAILINPFMSCGARLPIYLVFIGAFFPKYGGLVLFLIYLSGIVLALLLGKLFSKTLFKGEASHFIMELPTYRLPIPYNVIRDMWEKVWDFLKRAGTIIFIVVSLLWILSVLPAGVEPYSEASILGKVGSFIAPIFKPAGFGNWQAAVSLFAGIAAKEAVIGVLGMVYVGVSEGSELVLAISKAFTPLSAVSFLAMTLIYTPCAAVIGTVKKETGSWKWAAFMAIYPFVLGWTIAVIIYQVGTLLGF